MNPYLTLDLAPNATDEQIRRAYLDGIKVATPDTHPKRFQEISAAYEAIKDETSRLKYYLFDRQCPAESPLDAFLQFARSPHPPKPLPFEAMKELLRACSKT
jgi:curved DNA-binding protein CbpA